MTANDFSCSSHRSSRQLKLLFFPQAIQLALLLRPGPARGAAGATARISLAKRQQIDLSNKERLAFDLFNSSPAAHNAEPLFNRKNVIESSPLHIGLRLAEDRRDFFSQQWPIKIPVTRTRFRGKYIPPHAACPRLRRQ